MQLHMLRACDVCRLVDFDPSPKLCIYCILCDAWMCEGCFGFSPRQLARRAIAASKRLLEPGAHSNPKYVEELNRVANEANKGA